MAAAMDDPHFSVRQPIPARVPEQRHFPAARHLNRRCSLFAAVIGRTGLFAQRLSKDGSPISRVNRPISIAVKDDRWQWDSFRSFCSGLGLARWSAAHGLEC